MKSCRLLSNHVCVCVCACVCVYDCVCELCYLVAHFKDTEDYGWKDLTSWWFDPEGEIKGERKSKRVK